LHLFLLEASFSVKTRSHVMPWLDSLLLTLTCQ